MTDISDLIARWNADEGKPYKGYLIDMGAWNATPGNIGCMCAQGQVLHLLRGWDPQRLQEATQREADAEVAKALNISRAHAALLREINDRADGAPSVVLTNPRAVLGDQWSRLLDFWWHLDGMNVDAIRAARDAAWDAARAAAWDAAWDAAWAAAWDAAWAAAWDAAWDAAWASSEIHGADVLRDRGQPFFFLPMFGFASPEEIPPRPRSYPTFA